MRDTINVIPVRLLVLENSNEFALKVIKVFASYQIEIGFDLYKVARIELRILIYINTEIVEQIIQNLKKEGLIVW